VLNHWRSAAAGILGGLATLFIAAAAFFALVQNGKLALWCFGASVVAFGLALVVGVD